jgi:chemotaxis protein MotB
MASHPRRRPSHERWLVSYADFMTLLFAFFATMYAISSVDAQKLAQIAHGLQVAFDDSARIRPILEGAGSRPDRPAPVMPAADALSVGGRLARDLARELADHQLEITMESRGLVISIPEAGSFGIGRDELSQRAESLIGRIANTLRDVPNAIRVEGHTDDVPIHTPRFRSNWDLSTARATRVVEFLSERVSIAPQRLSAAGYGEFHPRVANDGSDNRARNRRVDIVILNAATSAAEEPAQGPAR